MQSANVVLAVEGLVDSVPYAASAAVWSMMASNSIGVNLPRRR